MSTINWTPRADNPDVLDGEPGGYLIEIIRARNGRRRGEIVNCRVWRGDIISFGKPGFGKPSLDEAKAYAERHAAYYAAKARGE